MYVISVILSVVMIYLFFGKKKGPSQVTITVIEFIRLCLHIGL